MNMEDFALARILKFLPGIILGLTVHEFSHAYIANRCGDSTSKEQGRLTLNPLKHIDLLGFIMLMVAGFGWAKPVEFNEQKLRNPGKDVIKIAVAGPLSNALTAIVLSVLYTAFFHFVPAYSGQLVKDTSGGDICMRSLLTGDYLFLILSPSRHLTDHIFCSTILRNFPPYMRLCTSMVPISFLD